MSHTHGSKTLIVRSIDRESGNSSDYRLEFKQSIFALRNENVTLQLKEISIPNTFYTITTGYNDVIDFNLGGVLSATISPGAYTSTSLATELETVMNAASAGGFTVTYSIYTFKYTIANVGAFTLLFSTGTNTTTHSRSLWKILGFTDTNGLNAVDTTSGTSATATSIVNVNTPQSFNIRISGNGGTYSGMTNARSVMYTSIAIPITSQSEGFSTMMHYALGQVIRTHQKAISHLQISVVDDDGAVISLNGGEWFMVFEVINSV